MSVATSTSVAAVVETAPGPSTSTGPASSHTGSSAPDRVTLRLVPRRPQRKGVRWTNETVDNEGLGRKSSKKCCIFHKRRQFGDWSDDEDSDAECECPDPPKASESNDKGAGPAQ